MCCTLSHHVTSVSNMSSLAGEDEVGDGDRSGPSSGSAGPGFVGFEPAAATVASTDRSQAAVLAARLLATTDTKGLSNDECLGVYDDIELARRSLGAMAAGVAAEIDGRGLCDLRYGSATVAWFERRHGRSRSSVGRDVKTGRRLRLDLDVLHGAVLRGEISFERVAFIVGKVNDRNVAAFNATQEALLELSAAEPSWAMFTASIAALARYADADGGHDPSEQKSRVSLRRVGEEVVLDGVFVGLDSETVEKLVEAETTRLWRQWCSDCDKCPELEMPSRNEIRARAIVELIRRGRAADPSTSKATVAELSLVIDADRLDELDPILAAVLDPTGRYAHTHTTNCFHDQHPCPGRRPGIGGLIGVPVTGTAGNQVWFTPSEWELLVCNADISEVILDKLGMPVAVRNRARFPNRAMRRALDIRDAGCVFPGCDAPTGWCDAHHVVEYDADDGETVIGNLALLCRHHHGIIHRTGWSMRLSEPGTTPDTNGARDGYFTITTADGLELRTEHRRRPAPPPGREPAPA